MWLARSGAIALGLGACVATGDPGEANPKSPPSPMPEGDGARYSLYVHGRHTEGVPDDWSYWGHDYADDRAADPPPGVNPIAVNYDGGGCISVENRVVVAAFDDYCRGANECYVACHSLGCAQVGYALSRHGVIDGERRWNILWVDAAGSAAGGSELADDGSWLYSDCAIANARTSVVRALYDHNATAGTTFYMFAGARGNWWSALLTGQDDEVVAYHSAGGVRYVGSYCNPGDWFCNTVLELGVSPQLFSHHEVHYRDDHESYNHTLSSGGIVAPMFHDMKAFAR